MLQRFLIFATMNNVFDELDINDLLENPDSELKQDMKELAESEFKRNTSLYVDFCIMSDIGFKRQLSHLKRWLKQLIWITGHQPAEVVELSKIVINDDHSYPNRIVKKLVTHIDISRFTLLTFMQLTKALLSNKNVFSFDAGNLLISNQQIDKKKILITKRNNTRQMYLDRNFLSFAKILYAIMNGFMPNGKPNGLYEIYEWMMNTKLFSITKDTLGYMTGTMTLQFMQHNGGYGLYKHVDSPMYFNADKEPMYIRFAAVEEFKLMLFTSDRHKAYDDFIPIHLILETERDAKETDLLYKNVQKHLHELRIRALNCVCYPDDVKQYVLFLGFWRDHKTNDGAFVMAASKKMKVGRPMPRVHLKELIEKRH